MNNDDYSKIKEGINKGLYLYNERKIDDTKFNLKLSNGESINIKYKPKNIAHLLGINIDYLRSTKLYIGSSTKILKTIYRNFDTFINQIEQNEIKETKVFSSYINEKLENFERTCGINLCDIEFIVDYKRSRNLKQIEPLYDGYYIGYKDNDNLSVIGFKQDEINNVYYPNTNRLVKLDTKEANKFLNRLFENQSTTTVDIMYSKLMDNEGNTISTPYYYNHTQLLEATSKCKKYAETYGGIPNTINSNLYYINKIINLNNSYFTIIDIYKEIEYLMSKNKRIDILKLKEKYNYIDDSILGIVNCYNNSLVNSNNSSYSNKNLVIELENLKQELEKKQLLLSKIEDENNQLEAKIELLKMEKESLNENRKQLIKRLSRQKK